MTLDDIKQIFSDIQKCDLHINRFSIIGGEPTLNRHIFDICYYIQQSSIDVIELLTNFINKNIIFQILKKYSRIHIMNLDGNTSDNIKFKKFMKHINIYMSPYEEHLKQTPCPCNIYNKYYCESGCGIHIFKKDGKLKYMYSSVCSAIIRLLGYDNLFFDNIEGLIRSNHFLIYEKICKHCMMGNEFPVLVKDNIQISNIFKPNIKKIMQ